MFDGAGDRVWGSNDCFPEAGSDPRTLAPGEVVALPLVWGGLTSEPTCTAPPGAPGPGAYTVRGPAGDQGVRGCLDHPRLIRRQRAPGPAG